MLVQVNHEEECQSIVPINETLIRQLESANEHYARQYNSCIGSLQSSENEVNALKIENRQHESEKKKYKNDFEKTQKKLQLAEEKVDAFDKDESELRQQLKELKNQLKDIRNEKNEFKLKNETAMKQEKRKREKDSSLFNVFILVSKFVFYFVLFNFRIKTHDPKRSLTDILIRLIIFEIVFYFELFLNLFTAFIFSLWVEKRYKIENYHSTLKEYFHYTISQFWNCIN